MSRFSELKVAGTVSERFSNSPITDKGPHAGAYRELGPAAPSARDRGEPMPIKLRRQARLAAGLVAVLASTNAEAMTCDQFLANVQAADKDDLLPDFEVSPQEGMADGYLEITNLKSIQTGLHCENGEFDSFGAALVNTQPADLVRWTVLIVASVKAVSPSSKNPAGIAKAALRKARADAAKNEVRTGASLGVSETALGAFTLELTFIKPDGFQFDISPAE